MMIERIALIAASWGLAILVGYFAWVRIRVVLLREEIFLIRDALWDEAQDLNSLDDPAYRQARLRLNGLIRGADSISLPVMLYILHNQNRLEPAQPQIVSENLRLQEAIDGAYKATGELVMRYIFDWTLIGRVSRPLSRVVAFFLIELPAILRWLKSDGPNQLPTDGQESPA